VQAHPEDAFKIDARELNQITIVGMILAVTEAATNVSFNVDDGTGKIEVRIWLDSEEPAESANEKRAGWRVGAYIRVIGHLRSFNNKRSVMAFRIQPIVDLNEITYHLCECVYVHLQNTKGNLQGSSSNTSTTAPTSFANAYSAPQATLNSHLSDIHGQVLTVIRTLAAHRSEGISVQQIASQVKCDIAAVRHAMEFLSSEGHVYSTIDEDHFQVTDSM